MYRKEWKSLQWISAWAVLAGFLFVLPANAQIGIGSETSLSMNGELGAGYAGEFGNETNQSSHGLFFTGLANLNGYYHNPKFLNFNVQPYYNRSQDNSSFQSVLSETGVVASVNLFSGSHFPGSVSYSTSWQVGSQFQIAGQPGLSGNGDTQNFAVTWSALVTNWPTLTATYSDSSSSATILGETGTNSTSSRFLNLFSTYQLYGFQINGFFNHQNTDSTFPEFITGSSLESSSSGNSYGISASHKIPLSGSVGFGVSRYNYKSDDNFGLSTDGTSDTAIASIGLNPTRRLSVTGTARYYDNLFGELQQNGTLPPGSVPITTFGSGISGLTLNTFASYNLGKGLILVGYANRQMQQYAGTEYDSNQWGATLTYNYARPLFGLLYLSFGTVNTTGNGNQGYLGFVGNLGLKKKIDGWEINADIAYAQNVQSSIALFTTSNYNYGGSVRKRFFDNTYFTASYQAIQTALTQLAGYNTRSETAIATLNRRWLGLSASYSQTNGTSILTSSGTLVPTPVPLPIVADQVVYAGTAYGAGLGLTPVRRMVINVNWFRVHNETQGTFNSIFTASDNDSDRVYAQLQYNVRKLIVRSTYWRVNQLVSSSGLGRQTVNSYSFSISRWFNFF
ncbi:MAG TPA: hypothetical protein VIH91_11305 [Terriglobales bacterium]